MLHIDASATVEGYFADCALSRNCSRFNGRSRTVPDARSSLRNHVLPGKDSARGVPAADKVFSLSAETGGGSGGSQVVNRARSGGRISSGPQTELASDFQDAELHTEAFSRRSSDSGR